MDISKIMSLLPHRYPMLLVDRVTELIPFESIIAYKNITVNEDVFNGHFPSNPIFPGVMTLRHWLRSRDSSVLHQPKLQVLTVNYTYLPV